MDVTRKIQYKDEAGVVSEYDIGALAQNVAYSNPALLPGVEDVGEAIDAISGSLGDLTETGTWPAEVRYNGGTASGTVAPATSVLSKYSVLGDLVLIEFSAGLSKEVLASTDFSNLRVYGLPFTFTDAVRTPVDRIQLKPDVFIGRGYFSIPIAEITSGNTWAGFYLASWGIQKADFNLVTTVGGANITISFRFIARRA